jgi:hypothetical protein
MREVLLRQDIPLRRATGRGVEVDAIQDLPGCLDINGWRKPLVVAGIQDDAGYMRLGWRDGFYKQGYRW